MRLAWFRELPLAPSTPTDESAPCLHELGHTHEIDVYTVGNAHDFVWMHHRRPYDLCIYEFPQAHLRSFMHAYAVHYPELTVEDGIRIFLTGGMALPSALRSRGDAAGV